MGWRDRLVERDGHMVWQGKLDGKGRARAVIDGKRVYLHRWLWERELGPLEGRVLIRTCMEELCLNPRHFDAVDAKEAGAVRSRSFVLNASDVQLGEWRASAACRGLDPSAFLTGAPEALSACSGCPVRAECAAEGDRLGSSGVWGGELR